MTQSIGLKSMPFDSYEITNDDGSVSYDRVAYSADLANWMQTYFSNGILIRGTDKLTNELKVTHQSGMTVEVAEGAVLINGRTGWVEGETLTLDVGGSQPRIDRIVMELNIADRYVYLKVLKGIEAAEPAVPELTQTEDVYQIKLAQVNISAGSSVIASVTDERTDISNIYLNYRQQESAEAIQVIVSEAVKNAYGDDVLNVDEALQKVAPDKIKKIVSDDMGLRLRTIIGTYTGNGPAEDNEITKQTIEVGVTPIAVLIAQTQNGFNAYANSTFKNIRWGGLALPDSHHNGITIVENGFEVVMDMDTDFGTAMATNEKNTSYNYIVWY